MVHSVDCDLHIVADHARATPRSSLDLNQIPDGRYPIIDRAAPQNGTDTPRTVDRKAGLPSKGGMLNGLMSSFAAFLAAGVRPPTRLAKAITLVLMLKLLAIAGASIFLFSINERPTADPGAVSRLIGPSTPSLNEGRR
jgi:hypothetical protein